MTQPALAQSTATSSAAPTAEPVTATSNNGGFQAEQTLDGTADATSSPVPPEVTARVGTEFHHTEDESAERHYRITPDCGFLVTMAPGGRGVGTLEFRHDNKYKTAWETLAAFIVSNAALFPPTVPDAPAAKPAPAPAEESSLIGDLVGAITDTVIGVIDAGLALIGNATQIIQDAFDLAFGSEEETTSPTAPGMEAPGTEPPAATPAEPAPAESTVDLPAMSQFHWYSFTGAPLNIDAVFAAATAISTTFGFGGPVRKINAPTAEDKKLDGNHGYFWFQESGAPAPANVAGSKGTQCVTFNIKDGETTAIANPLTAYLSAGAPGARAETIRIGKEDVPVAADIKNLDLRNIPGWRSCFATTESMLAIKGAKAVAAGDVSEMRIVTSETYDSAGKVIDVACDAAMMAKAKAYLDYETARGKPVLTGITYKRSDLNKTEAHPNEQTDHFVAITGHKDAVYLFNNPSNGSSGNEFKWNGVMLNHEQPKEKEKHPERKYVVSWIRPNAEGIQEWEAHWAAMQAGGEKTPDAE